MDDVLYAKVYATLRNLSDPIVVVNECPGSLQKQMEMIRSHAI